MTTSVELIAEIHTLCPNGVPNPNEDVRAALRERVRALIRIAEEDGRIAEDPRVIALTRKVTLDETAVGSALSGKHVLITGAAGCVAGALIERMRPYSPAMLAGLDKRKFEREGVIAFEGDVRDTAALERVFQTVAPDVVFHLAAEREPGRAERAVYDAVTTNVFGAEAVIEACSRFGVQSAVYSSTGKCFAYLTDHVYTGTKKLAEQLWAEAARTDPRVAFGVVRFTHLLENGIVFREIEQGLAEGLVSIHGPNRHFNLQNVDQATGLLLHALATTAPGQVRCWVANDIGWPVNVLDFALWRIAQAGGETALRFLGVPPGYDEDFFRGQFDWSGAQELHPLVNALETDSLSRDETGTLASFSPQPATPDALREAIGRLREEARTHAQDPERLKRALLATVYANTQSQFAHADGGRLEDILRWGLDPTFTTPEKAARFGLVITLLEETLKRRGLKIEPDA